MHRLYYSAFPATSPSFCCEVGRGNRGKEGRREERMGGKTSTSSYYTSLRNKSTPWKGCREIGGEGKKRRRE